MSMSDLAIDAPEVFEFLDNLRESGKTNMFGAAPFVQQAFDLNKFESRYLVSEWMRTFSERHPA